MVTNSEKGTVKDTEGNERGQIELGLTPRHLIEKAEKNPRNFSHVGQMLCWYFK